MPHLTIKVAPNGDRLLWVTPDAEFNTVLVEAVVRKDTGKLTVDVCPALFPTRVVRLLDSEAREVLDNCLPYQNDPHSWRWEIAPR